MTSFEEFILKQNTDLFWAKDVINENMPILHVIMKTNSHGLKKNITISICIIQTVLQLKTELNEMFMNIKGC